MANQQSKTNAQKVRQQNQASAQGGQFGTEFASETDAQQVRQNNQQAEQKNSKTANH
ncbi:gamma-type small acid-soluble spore protein [Bacillus sp. FSL K6-3846]|uniref:gamma-type small acid-soluble spore protein n=1 Tax=Bacillus sp. FSL K6-3846 TaxID=2954750 RepID=UPI0008282139|nr:spore protein [Bacillus paralicheniformis]OMI11333.1 gamma-type small acid-soluble spore protein [Bacillus paralicheniformis]WOH92216.1 gamma-type small acid-soluble spore protein [Bacillus paralicheniformis]